MSTNIDQDFVEFVIKSLVGKPEAVVIERRIDEKGVLLELTVDPEDLGRVIGKRGATAQSLRTLLRALGTKNDARYNLKIIDNGVQDHGHAHSDASSSDSQITDTSQPDTSQSDSKLAATQDDSSAVAPASNSTADLNDELGLSNEDTPPVASSTESDDRLSRTRKELAEFDDLDV